MNNASHALGEYKVGKRIANGGFGFVFGGKAPDGTKVAIKYERTYNRIKRPYLQHEANVYRLFEGNPCIPKIYAYGREARFNIMVFDLLGTSLETLFEKCGDKFSLKTTLMLAPQIIECIEYCHNKGIIHRDIKPDNFLMGRGERVDFVHIIDFGLARRFQNPRTNKHFPYFEGHNFFGTTRFASLKALEGCSQSRRDDLESAAYSLIYFMRGRLPWQGLRGGTDKHRDQRVREKKRTWVPERLCEGLPDELAKMLEYVKSLGYEDEPDYAYLKKLFTDRLEKEGFELDYDYDWLHIVDEESDTGSGASLTGSKKVSVASARVVNRISIDPGDADDEAEVPARNTSQRAVSRGISMSIRGERGGKKSPLSALDAESKVKSPAKASAVSSDSASDRDKSDVSGSSASESSVSQSDKPSKKKARKSFSSSFTESRNSKESQAPIKKGDFVLVKFLARPTLEGESPLSDSSAPVDNSYWHNPELSEDKWHFPYRPALVTNVNSGSHYTRLYVLPIMERADGLAKISAERRTAFFQINSNEIGARSETGEDAKLTLRPTPAWPREGTYVHHQYDVFRILVPTEAVKHINVVWRLDKEQLRELFLARDDVMDVINNDDYLSDAGSETDEVRRRQRRKRVISNYPVYGDITSLTEEALAHTNVDLQGSNGWLREYFKTDRRRNHENGYYTGDSDYSTDSENVSMFTGPSPGNRRLSCTLAIDGDVILEAAGSDVDSLVSSRYRSPRSSYRSKGSSRRSKASSFRSGAGSAANSVAGSVRSLRHAVLNHAARSNCNSPTCSTHISNSDSDISEFKAKRFADSSLDSSALDSSDPGSSSRLSSHTSLPSSSMDSYASSSPGYDESSSLTNSNAPGSSAPSNAESSAVSSRSTSDASSVAESIVGSAAGSVAALARTVAETLVGSGNASVNQKASTAEGRVMVDRAVQTTSPTGIVNDKASAVTGKVMVDQAVQTGD